MSKCALTLCSLVIEVIPGSQSVTGLINPDSDLHSSGEFRGQGNSPEAFSFMKVKAQGFESLG
jgi:hypothetical protein